MPDGDILHPKLWRSYQQPYQQLCEGKMSAEDLAHEISSKMKNELQRANDTIAPLLRLCAAQLNGLPKSPLFQSAVDWEAESLSLRGLMQSLPGDRRYMGMALQVCLRTLSQIAMGNQIPSQHMLSHLYKGFVERLYKARFGDLVLTVNDHFDKVPSKVLETRLQNLNTPLQHHFKLFGDQLARSCDGEEARLRQPPRPREVVDDLNAPALSII